MPVPVSETFLKALFANLGRYLANLARAGSARKEASRKALQGVILATRKTRVYLRQLQDDSKEKGARTTASGKRGEGPRGSSRAKRPRERTAGNRHYATEEELSEIWTRLAFELRGLGVTALAKRCDITGGYWADPDSFSQEFLGKARVRLKDIESDARILLGQIR